ncbi:hypothetical protein OHB49_09255 [Streptomyces sp. NBC_01717]|uniref:hypothetical protein n=1 Tax=Streptomyces sp. NBC_01717 TaxID=2975918 RepID=UPI002E34A863|nr:hypothetical protein [Streptomyces sp. NBC_01717]
MRPFTTWVLLRRARRQAGGRLHTTSAPQRIRRRVRQALLLLDRLDAHHLDLATLDQNRLDTWFSANRSHYEVKQFLDWAAQRGLTDPFTIATPPTATAAPSSPRKSAGSNSAAASPTPRSHWKSASPDPSSSSTASPANVCVT